MKKINELTREKYHQFDYKLENDFRKASEDPTFKKVISTLNQPEKELMKHTTKLEDTVKELEHCKNCKNILECQNLVTGYIYFPTVENDSIIFSYIPCKYKKKLDAQKKYQQNVYTIDIPKEIKEASMRDIHTDDKERFEVIKWLKEFIDDYKQGHPRKGLFLTGNFGCGKTYLISAMLNELAKQNHQVAIIYYPELLRSLKESFNDEYSFQELFNKVKKSELLLIDDIGAETTTQWGRDEILGTILQYRMQEKLVTFFTSNLSLKELEEHISISNKGVEKVKARRIIERIKQLTEIKTMVSVNKRK